ncbi:hypothetical protein M0805_000083 [Coniferiporia weirii]|nr:hypothetical protein M0805_000083 [Coniferiporia weirii]
MPVPLTSNAQHNQQQQHPARTAPLKNVKHKSSKPIINWLQRKLGGTGRARRASDPSVPRTSSIHTRVSGVDSSYSGRTTGLKQLHGAMLNARTSTPRDADENRHFGRAHVFRPLSNEISLNSTDDASDNGDDDAESNRRSSGAAVSMWGSRSNPLEADEDASIRPLPPTSPPSPSPSRSSSSYMSSPRTFQSMSASTKPTTLLSIDLAPMGMAHIAQAPPTPTSVSAYNTPGPSPIARFPHHVRSGSTGPNGAVTFSALPPSTPPSSRPSSLGPAGRGGVCALQAPAHTSHHPRNNPRPSSPPLDNASVLTLASSAFAAPFAERGRSTTQTPYQYSWTAGADSASHLSHVGGGGDSLSHIMLDGELAAEELNASVRALRPRSSRRDSWESEVSRWSAGASVLGGLGSMGRERSVRTAPSYRTGGQNTMDADDMASMCLLDEDVASLREGGLYDERDRAQDNEEDGRAFSPISTLSAEDASDQTEVKDTSSLRDDADDVATPGPEARTLELTPPPLDTMPVPAILTTAKGEKRPSTPPSFLISRETETTPTKEKKIVMLPEVDLRA